MSGTRGGRGRIVALGVGLALALLLLAASEAKAGKYAVAQCGWHLGVRRRLGRHDGRGEVPPGLLLRDARRRRPVRRRPSEELHPRRAADRLRHPFRPLALDDAARHRHRPGQRKLVARPPRRLRAAARHGRRRRRLRSLCLGRRDRRHAARLRRRLLASPVGLRRPAALRPRRGKVLQPRTGLLVGVAGPDHHGRGRCGADRVDRRRRSPRRGWRRGAQGLAGLGRGRRGRGPLRRNDASMAPAWRSPSTPARRLMIGGEWRATTMRPCDTAVAAAQTIATDGFSDGPHQLVHCLTDFAGNVGCLAPAHDPGRQQPAGPPALAGLAGGEGWRRVNDFDLAWSNPDQGAASPIAGAYWRITERRRLRQRRPARRAGATSPRSPTARFPPPAPTSSISGCATKRATTRRRPRSTCRCASTTFPPASPSRPTEGGGFPDSVSADLYDEHSGPAGGELRYRRLGADSWTDLQARFVRGDAAGKGQLTARLPESLAPGTYVFRAEAVDAAGNAAASTTARRRHRDDSAQAAASAAERREPRRGRTGKAPRGAWQDADIRPPALARAARHRGDRALRRGLRPQRPARRCRRRRPRRDAA